MSPQQLKISGKHVSLHLPNLKEHIRVFVIIFRPKLQVLCGVEVAPPPVDRGQHIPALPPCEVHGTSFDAIMPKFAGPFSQLVVASDVSRQPQIQRPKLTEQIHFLLSAGMVSLQDMTPRNLHADSLMITPHADIRDVSYNPRRQHQPTIASASIQLNEAEHTD
jgi:hypothetical protein